MVGEEEGRGALRAYHLHWDDFTPPIPAGFHLPSLGSPLSQHLSHCRITHHEVLNDGDYGPGS